MRKYITHQIGNLGLLLNVGLGYSKVRFDWSNGGMGMGRNQEKIGVRPIRSAFTCVNPIVKYAFDLILTNFSHCVSQCYWRVKWCSKSLLRLY
jgi:hypothetical protein